MDERDGKWLQEEVILHRLRIIKSHAVLERWPIILIKVRLAADTRFWGMGIYQTWRTAEKIDVKC